MLSSTFFLYQPRITDWICLEGTQGGAGWGTGSPESWTRTFVSWLPALRNAVSLPAGKTLILEVRFSSASIWIKTSPKSLCPHEWDFLCSVRCPKLSQNMYLYERCCCVNKHVPLWWWQPYRKMPCVLVKTMEIYLGSQGKAELLLKDVSQRQENNLQSSGLKIF